MKSGMVLERPGRGIPAESPAGSAHPALVSVSSFAPPCPAAAWAGRRAEGAPSLPCPGVFPTARPGYPSLTSEEFRSPGAPLFLLLGGDSWCCCPGPPFPRQGHLPRPSLLAFSLPAVTLGRWESFSSSSGFRDQAWRQNSLVRCFAPLCPRGVGTRLLLPPAPAWA